jgi:iron complex transport system substrate-binding protein
MAARHWVPELARLAGGGDPLGQAGEPSRDAGWDEIVAAAPDVVVLMPCGFDLARTLAVSADVTRRPGFGQLPAARTAGVVAADRLQLLQPARAKDARRARTDGRDRPC